MKRINFDKYIEIKNKIRKFKYQFRKNNIKTTELKFLVK